MEQQQQPIIHTNGTQEWRVNGKYHRDGDMPARIHADGSQSWLVNGRCHRDGDMPAYIDADGSQEWWMNGKRHRDEDMPASIGADGTQEWWVNGVQQDARAVLARRRSKMVYAWSYMGNAIGYIPEAIIRWSVTRFII